MGALKKVGVLFLKSQYVRTIVTASVSAGVSTVVAKGWLPEELQAETITYFTAAATVGINLLAEHLLKDGVKAGQMELNKTLAPESRLKVDGVPGPETLQAQATVVRQAPDAIHVPKRRQPKPMNGGRGSK